MGDKPGKYWDVNVCAWVKSPATAEPAVVPAQATGEEKAPVAPLPIERTQ